MDTMAAITGHGRPGRGAAAVLIGFVLATAGCSSSGSAATASAGSGGGGATPGPAATSAQSTDQPAAPSQPGGGGTASGGCDFVTPAEMATAIGSGALTTKLAAGPPDTCGYLEAGASIPDAAVVYTPVGGDAAFQAVAGAAGATAIPGIGDHAAYDPELQELVVIKGGKLLAFQVILDDSKLPAPRLDVLKAIATIAADRL